jgi:hypothetical protein
VAHAGGSSADRGSESASHGSPAAQVGIFARSGEYWIIRYSRTTFSLKDIKGLGYIQRLLQHPGEEFHALDLLNESGVGPGSEVTSKDKALSRAVSAVGLGDAGEMLDARAKQDYKHRLLELTEELEDLRERGNQERLEKVESEIEFLTRESARAVGLGGRDRRAGSIAGAGAAQRHTHHQGCAAKSLRASLFAWRTAWSLGQDWVALLLSCGSWGSDNLAILT